jgi:anti-sigma regulatory factor (Ser/Thr protein kinase)
VTVEVELPSTPAAPAEARQLLESFAPRLVGPRLDDVRLLVSELVTNAVRHAGLHDDDRIRLLVRLDAGVLHVEVSDPGMGFERKRVDPDPERASGWGLYLVEELADRWGMAGERGTMIWFELDGDLL